MRFSSVSKMNGFLPTFKRYPDDFDLPSIPYSHTVFHTTSLVSNIPLLLDRKCRLSNCLNPFFNKPCLPLFAQSE